MKIEENIALPTPRKAKGEMKEIFTSLKIGDSFAEKLDTIPSSEINYRGAINASARYYGIKVACRKVIEDCVWVIRTWRTA